MRYTKHMEYSVKLPRFEGPYTKLLDLLQERKLSITEIDLASLADDYISYTKSLEKKDHLDISHFIVVASTLMLMKVRSLLPKTDYTSEFEKEAKDLTEKLILLDFLQKKATELLKLFSPKKFASFGAVRIKKKEYSLPKNANRETLFQSAHRLLTLNKKESLLREISIVRKYTMKDATDLIRRKLEGKVSLQKMSLLIDDKDALVISFLSVLELIRLGEISAYQERGQDIILERINYVTI